MKYVTNDYQEIAINLHFIKSHHFASNFIEVTFW